MRLKHLTGALFWLYAIDRVGKTITIAHFMGKRRPKMPDPAPTITLLQPITLGASDLQAALEARAKLRYPANIQHLLVCDRGDSMSKGICNRWIKEHRGLDALIIEVESEGGIASKTAKLQAGLAHAANDIVVCVDDDIILRPDAVRTLIPYLAEPGAGAAFGIACYIDWSNLPSGLMSAFVNTNALFTYIPGTYLTEPFTITGHIFAVPRVLLLRSGGFSGLENNIADDHILAERIRNAGLRVIQSPMIYDVVNHLPAMRDYAAQMKRWFVFPRQALIPLMTPKQQAITLLLSLGNMIPGLMALIALITRKRIAISALIQTMAIFNITHTLAETLYLKHHPPITRRLLLTLSALISPIQIAASLLSNNDIVWRGRRLKIERGGGFVEDRR